MQVKRFVNSRQTTKCSSACSCFKEKKKIQLKVITSHLKMFFAENVEVNQFALEGELKGKLAELKTGKQKQMQYS